MVDTDSDGRGTLGVLPASNHSHHFYYEGGYIVVIIILDAA